MFRFLIFLAIATVPLLAGCSRGPETVEVYGVVTLDGEAPPADGMLFFTAVEPAEGVERRPGQAKFDASGRYEATTFSDGDGLVPGKYRVGVHCWKTPPEMGGPPPVSHLPDRYSAANTSGIELVVEPGEGSREFDIKMTSP